jgi:hypothetical protein
MVEEIYNLIDTTQCDKVSFFSAKKPKNLSPGSEVPCLMARFPASSALERTNPREHKGRRSI